MEDDNDDDDLAARMKLHNGVKREILVLSYRHIMCNMPHTARGNRNRLRYNCYTRDWC